jgi:transcription initiation factor TFIID subunit 2
VTNDQHAAASTLSFFKLCRKLCGFDARIFAEQWIFGSGCPRLLFKANFNRKRMAVEITLQQHSPAYEKNKDDPARMQLLRPVNLFEGHLTVRIHEADGTPYEHVLDVHLPYKKYDVPFNTKYKRVRRNTKRFIARQQAAAQAAQGDTEAAEAIGMIDIGFGLELWEDPKERENWKVADWTEEDEQVMAAATYEWIRMDADFEWLTIMSFDQPDFMWVSQLQRDRDVVAQLEAIQALIRRPTSIVSGTLTKCVLVTNYFHRIRVEAALGLVSCALADLSFIGLFHLFKIFLRYCHTPTNKDQDLFTHKYVPVPNDFSDFSEYLVRKVRTKMLWL